MIAHRFLQLHVQVDISLLLERLLAQFAQLEATVLLLLLQLLLALQSFIKILQEKHFVSHVLPDTPAQQVL